MRSARWLEVALGALLAGTFPIGVFAQPVISAQSGTVQYVEGSVYADNHVIQRKFGQFPALHEGQELRTEDGRAEMLLTPGAFLRLTDHSAIRMISTRLSDTRVEIVKGSVMVECDELLKDNRLSLVYEGDTIQLEKHGLYRLDTDPSAQFLVYQGGAVVNNGAKQVKLGSGKEAALDSAVAIRHFDAKTDKDDFYQWSGQRSGDLAYATVTASQSVLNNGTTAWHTGGWMWSSLLDEYTFLPGSGMLYSPFGFGFWSPLYMSSYYVPGYYGAPGYYTAPVGKYGPGTPIRSGGAAPDPRPGVGRPVPPSGNGSAQQSAQSVANSSSGGGFGGASSGGFGGGHAGGGFSGGGFGGHAGGGAAGAGGHR
jgi:ATP-dependent protease HslVU (ClpYQ) peptidase subunit